MALFWEPRRVRCWHSPLKHRNFTVSYRSPRPMAPYLNRPVQSPWRDLCHVFIKLYASVKCESKKLKLSSVPMNCIRFAPPPPETDLLLPNKITSVFSYLHYHPNKTPFPTSLQTRCKISFRKWYISQQCFKHSFGHVQAVAHRPHVPRLSVSPA